MANKKKALITCPHCGETIPQNSSACPECGSDEDTGWSESTYLDGIVLPDDGDYEEALVSEFSASSGKKKHGKLWVIIAGIIALAVFLLGYVVIFL
jgi:uncharacterized OB-fold protein